MENTGTNGELTCACSCRTGRVYVGTADGRVLQLAANAATESGRALSCVHWELRLCPESVTSVCGVEAQDKSTLLLVGSASGELVVLREELELRRFQLESAVQQICYDRDGAFIVGDILRNLYGVTQYEILWMKPLPAIASEGIECFYPPVAEPTVKAIAHAKLLDVEKTQSNYFLVATGQKHLLVTHRGKDFGVIPTQTPIEILASIPDGDEDIVLAAAENGNIYRLVSYRGTVSKDMPEFHFALEMWAQVSFPIKKLLPVKMQVSTSNTKLPNCAWICLGADGDVALFRGQERVKQWNAASFNATPNVALDFPVDLILLLHADANTTQQFGVIVFPERIHTFSLQ